MSLAISLMQSRNPDGVNRPRNLYSQGQ